MTSDQIRLVQESCAKVVPIADTAADLFYNKLFEDAPQLRSLFLDIADQKKKLVVMLDVAVAGLSDVGSLIPVVESLGQRHARYGVKEADYGTVADALLWTRSATRGMMSSRPPKPPSTRSSPAPWSTRASKLPRKKN
jgi:hemoglobin-like flavoprotein